MATGQGVIEFDFGSGAGSNLVTEAVPSAGISAGSKIEVYLMGTDSTATHNEIEHQLLPLLGVSLQAVGVSAGVGFTAQIATPARLTGTIKARYVWAD